MGINSDKIFFSLLFLFFINVKSKNIEKGNNDIAENKKKYNNIKIINSNNKKIFENNSFGYIVNDVYVEVQKHNNTDNDDQDDILKENILNSLTFSKNSYLNIKNSTISNNIRRIKRLFPFIEDVTFECKLNNERLDIIIKVKRYKTIKKIILKTDQETDLNKLNENYNNKYITDNIVNDIKNEVKKKFKNVRYIKIIDNETDSEEILKIKSQGNTLIVNNVDFVGNNSIKKGKLLNKINLKGLQNSSLGKNITSDIINTSLNNIKLTDLIQKAQKDFLYFGSLYFNKESFDNDKKTIIRIYQNNGYLDAKISKIEVKLSQNKKLIDIVYHIDEGKKYFVGKIDIIGNKNIKKDVLLRLINVKYGDSFNFTKIQENINGSPTNPLSECIKNLYGSLGYLKTNISLKIDSIIDNYVNITISINEGEIVKINKIKIVGNRFTNNNIFYRNSMLFPGDNYNNIKFLATQQNIMRNDFVNPNKTLITIDNDNNIQMIIEEKLIIEPVFNIKAQRVDKDYCCECCRCCLIAPSITLGAKLGNLNLRKLLHLKDPKYLFLGNGDTFNLNINYNPVDSRLDTGIEVTIKEITKNLGGGFGFNYISFRGAIDNEDNNFNEKKEDKKSKKMSFCENKVNKINIITRVIYSNFSRNISISFTPFSFNTTFGKNKYKIFKCYLDFPTGLEFKYSNISNSFWNNNGIDFTSSLIFSNPIVLLFKIKDKRYKLHKDIRFLNTFSFYKSIIKNLVFSLHSNIGFSKAINDNSSNFFKIKKDDNNNFETNGVQNTTFLYLNGLVENSNILRAINRSNCNLAFKLNLELRYLFLITPIVNSYVFCFFNGCNLFLGQDNRDYKYIKSLGKKNLLNPVRIYSLGIGVRIEPEILKMIVPLCFSIYFDARNKSLSFNIIKQA